MNEKLFSTDISPMPMNYASVWRRTQAVFLDALILIIPCYLFERLLPGVGGFIAGILYKPVFEGSSLSATPGKALVGIAVVSETGQRLTLLKSFLRYGASFLSGIIAGIGYILAFFTNRTQTLHDLLVQSVVIYRDSPSVNYFTVWLDSMKNLFGNDGSNVSRPNDFTSGSQSAQATQEIEQLFKLFQSGAISEDEYKEKKSKILGRI